VHRRCDACAQYRVRGGQLTAVAAALADAVAAVAAARAVAGLRSMGVVFVGAGASAAARAGAPAPWSSWVVPSDRLGAWQAGQGGNAPADFARRLAAALPMPAAAGWSEAPTYRLSHTPPGAFAEEPLVCGLDRLWAGGGPPMSHGQKDDRPGD